MFLDPCPVTIAPPVDTDHVYNDAPATVATLYGSIVLAHGVIVPVIGCARSGIPKNVVDLTELLPQLFTATTESVPVPVKVATSTDIVVVPCPLTIVPPEIVQR